MSCRTRWANNDEARTLNTVLGVFSVVGTLSVDNIFPCFFCPEKLSAHFPVHVSVNEFSPGQRFFWLANSCLPDQQLFAESVHLCPFGHKGQPEKFV